jgi:hypothetical protein
LIVFLTWLFEALDGVGGVDDAADLFGEGQEGMTRSQARRHTSRAATRVLVVAELSVSSSSTAWAASASGAV